jgi:hypothetical protein
MAARLEARSLAWSGTGAKGRSEPAVSGEIIRRLCSRMVASESILGWTLKLKRGAVDGF